MTRPSPQELLAEAARLAQVFHWRLDDIIDLEHHDRHTLLNEAELLRQEQIDEQRRLYDEYVEPAAY